MHDARVLVTRPAARARAWIEALAGAGVEVVHLPLWRLELPAPPERENVVRSIEEHARRSDGDRWLAFTSAAAVEHLMTIVDGAGAREPLARLQVACVGSATRAACEERGLGVSLVPTRATGAALGRALLERATAPRVLHATSSMAREELAAVVSEGGGTLVRCVVTVASPEPGIDGPAVAAAVEGLAVATFASPAAVDRLLELAAESVRQRLRATPAVAIGSTTRRALRAGGFERVVVASSPRVGDLVAAVRGVLGR